MSGCKESLNLHILCFDSHVYAKAPNYGLAGITSRFLKTDL